MDALTNTAPDPVSMPLGVGVGVAACIFVIAMAIIMRKDVKPLTLVWAVVFAAFAGFFAVWCALGLCLADTTTYCICEFAFAACGILVLQRERFVRRAKSRLDVTDPGNQAPAGWEHARENEANRTMKRIGRFTWARDLVLLAIAAFFAMLALETAENPEWTSIWPPYIVWGYLLIFVTMLALYFLGIRRGLLPILVTVVCLVFGAVQNFLDHFKNAAFLPSDIMAWQTAAAVSGGYTFTIDASLMWAIAYAAISLCCLAYIIPVKSSAIPAKVKVKRVAASLACFLVLGGGLFANFALIDYQKQFDIHLNYWDLRNSYHSRGFLVAFVAAAQDLVIDKPNGYTDESAKALQEELAARYDKERGTAYAATRKQFAKQQPNIIAVMNETYADMSVFEELHDGYTGTYVTQELQHDKGTIVSGFTNMSVHGGGTCNSEYEFLAQSSMEFIGRGMYPYQQFHLSKVDAMPSLFRSMGYATFGIHPNYPGNWNREFVYAALGMDKSFFIYDFDGARMFHDKVSDGATYDKALELIRENDDPTLVVDITMQNHGGYDSGSIAAEDLTDVKPDFGTADDIAQLNEYLSCIQASDKDLKALIKQLKDFDEPVAIVFFGDHQPSISKTINNELFLNEPEMDHAVRIMKTPYFIWTNYDVAGAQVESELESSPGFLAAQLAEAIGAPLSDYQKAMLVLHQDLLALNVNGYEDATGTWHDPNNEETASNPKAKEAFDQLQTLHYLNVVRKL